METQARDFYNSSSKEAKNKKASALNAQEMKEKLVAKKHSGV
jgi:hypothetical protein